MRKSKYSAWYSPALFMFLLLVFCSNAWTQTTITGKVLDSGTGEPLPGVNVIIDGTTTGTITDLDGNFELTVDDPNAKLNLSYVGYLTETVELNGQTSLEVSLVADLMEMEQVVVVGYGTMRKKDLTGAVSSVKSSDIASNKDANVLHALQGKVAGLDILPTDGQAGSGVEITLRGARSIEAGNDPLILVDGVEYGNKLDLNASDIESVDILKDAASTAIYGTRGANGVIIITTKKGKAGKTQVSYNMWTSYNQPNFFPNYMNGEQHLNKIWEKQIADRETQLWGAQGIYYNPITNQVVWDDVTYPNPTEVFGTVTIDQLVDERGVEDKYELANSDPTFLELARAGVSHNYIDMLLEPTWSHNHELSVRGGSDKTTYNLSLGYLNDHGLLKRDELDRYNFKLGLDHQINDKLKAGSNILFTRKFQQRRASAMFGYARNAGPIGTLYNEDGTYTAVPDPVFTANQYNPLLDNVEGAYIDETFTNRVFGNVYLDWKIIEGLSFRSNFALDYEHAKRGIYAGPRSTAQIRYTRAKTTLDNYEKTSYTWSNVLNYGKQLGVHNFQVMAGSETRYEQYDRSRFFAENQQIATTEYYEWTQFGGSIVADADYLTDPDRDNQWQYVQQQLVSFFGRANYSLMDKYLLQGTVRYDAASVLSTGNKGAAFPSFSAGWRLSEEDFMQNINFLNNLKLRYSWGVSGNSAIQPYKSTAALGQLPNYYSFGTQVYNQYVPYQTANEGLTWEITKAHNFGFDVGVLNSRIFGSFEYYISNTEDLLFKVPLPSTEGYPIALLNVAGSKNQGFEVQLTTVLINQNKFNWSVDWVFARNKNEITKLRGDVNQLPQDDDDLQWRVGDPIRSWYTFDHQGFYSEADLQAELDYAKQQEANGDTINRALIPMLANRWLPGDIKLDDKNLDGVYNDEDKIFLSSYPDYHFSVNSDMMLKTNVGDFGLYVQLIGRVGQTIRYRFYEDIKVSSDLVNGAYVQAWTPQNTDAVYPRYYSNGTANQQVYIHPIKFVDGSFVKIKDITFSYALPQNWTESIRISKLRVYVSARNMFTFSDIKDSDPELDGSTNWPLPKQIFFGLNLDF